MSAELNKADRTPGIKIFIGSSTGNLLVDEQEALERIFAETTLPICAHCEDEATVRANSDSSMVDQTTLTIRRFAITRQPSSPRSGLSIWQGVTITAFMCCTSRLQTNSRSSPITVDILTAEACPHHLLFNIEDYKRLGSLVQMNPSIKSPVDNAALWRGLNDGQIQVIATDHAPHTLEEKDQPYPNSPVRSAGGRELAGPDAQRGERRPLHVGAGRAVDV